MSRGADGAGWQPWARRWYSARDIMTAADEPILYGQAHSGAVRNLGEDAGQIAISLWYGIFLNHRASVLVQEMGRVATQSYGGGGGMVKLRQLRRARHMYRSGVQSNCLNQDLQGERIKEYPVSDIEEISPLDFLLSYSHEFPRPDPVPRSLCPAAPVQHRGAGGAAGTGRHRRHRTSATTPTTPTARRTTTSSAAVTAW